jgi:hypothetical protein
MAGTSAEEAGSLLQRLLKFAPAPATAWFKERAPIVCTCCGAVMAIVRTRFPSSFQGHCPLPWWPERPADRVGERSLASHGSSAPAS